MKEQIVTIMSTCAEGCPLEGGPVEGVEEGARLGTIGGAHSDKTQHEVITTIRYRWVEVSP